MKTAMMCNTVLTTLFGVFFLPFRGLDPVWALVAASFLTGALMVWIFGKVSNQEKIKETKDQVWGNLLAVHLFQNSMGVVLRSQLRVLRHTLVYMAYSFAPMLVMLVPVALIIIQLNLHFSVRPLRPGERALVKAVVRDSSALQRPIALLAPVGIAVETPPVRIPSKKEIAWRIRVDDSGHRGAQTALHVDVRDERSVVEKEIVVGGRWDAVSARRPGKGLLDAMLWPGEDPIPRASTFEAVEIVYPELPLTAFGWEIHWLVLFFVLSVLFGFLCKGFFGVTL
jgi:hypothetical protein